MSADREYETLGWTFSYLPHLGISLLAKAQGFPLCCRCPPPRADPTGWSPGLTPMADPPAELLGPKPFKMGLLSRLLANSSFSTKAFEKNHPPHPPHPPDYSLPRSAKLKLSALKKNLYAPWNQQNLTKKIDHWVRLIGLQSRYDTRFSKKSKEGTLKSTKSLNPTGVETRYGIS